MDSRDIQTYSSINRQVCMCVWVPYLHRHYESLCVYVRAFVIHLLYFIITAVWFIVNKYITLSKCVRLVRTALHTQTNMTSLSLVKTKRVAFFPFIFDYVIARTINCIERMLWFWIFFHLRVSWWVEVKIQSHTHKTNSWRSNCIM